MELYPIFFLILLALELAYFKVADKFDIIDKPNSRSSHTMITLRGGGIVFYFGAMLYLMLYGLHYPFFILSLTLISLISFLDDIHSVPAKLRLFIQLFSVALVLYEWGLFGTESVGFVLLALFIGVGILNAYNFMDGINGMTGGNNFILFCTLLLINQSVHFTDDRFLMVMLFSILIFDFFNFRTKAKCFAGDVGALALGITVFFIMGQLILKTGDFTYILLLAVYGMETGLTIIHRIFLRENILRPHRKHAFQILANELGWKHLHVAVFYASIQLVINIGLLTVGRIYSNVYFWIVCISLILAYILFMRKFFKLHQPSIIK